ncbi:MAG: hypothetical protein AAGE52_11915 [Myxococcota bacterium]
MRKSAFVLLLVACGGSPPAEETTPDDPEGTQAEPADPAAQQLEDDLNVVCDAATRAMQDRSQPVRQRIRQMEASLDANDPGLKERLQAFMRDVPREDGQLHASIASAAARHGVTFSCPPLDRMDQLQAAGDDDLDPNSIPPFEEDLARFCQVFVEFEGSAIDSAERAMQMAQALEDSIRHPALVTAFQAMASMDPSGRHEALQNVAAEHGVENWSCPAMQRFLAQ